MRIWIVLSILLGAFIGLMAYDSRPTRERILNQWYNSVSEIISENIESVDNRYIDPYKIRNFYFNKSEQENIALLNEFESNPSEKARAFALEIARINQEHEEKLAALPKRKLAYWGQALGWWLTGAALLFLPGWTVGWIVRGFRGRAT